MPAEEATFRFQQAGIEPHGDFTTIEEKVSYALGRPLKNGIERNISFLKDPLIVNDLFLKKPERIEVLGAILLWRCWFGTRLSIAHGSIFGRNLWFFPAGIKSQCGGNIEQL